jgi:hypothetical protein
MAAIPPLHEEPPVGTEGLTLREAPDHGPGVQEPPTGPPAAPGGEPVPQTPPLPADWSPVDPAPAEDPGPR